MQSIPAYHDPRGHISPMVTRRVGRNELLRTGSNCGGSGNGGHQGSMVDPEFNSVTATHGLQFAVQPTARGPFAANHNTALAGPQIYALNGTEVPPSITSSYEFSRGVNSGSGASAIPDPGNVNITASSNKIRIPVSAVRVLPSTTSSPSSSSGQSSSSHVFKPTSATASSSSRDRGVIRTTLSSTSTSASGGGGQSRRKSSPGKTTQQQQHQQQQPKDRQSFHAALIELFARDKKALLCPKCHQEGNIHRDGISEGKMRFTCNTMIPAVAASVGKRRKCNKHFYERTIHTMLIEIVRRKQHGALAMVGGVSTTVEASDLEGGFCTDMSSASPEIAPWHHPLLAGGSAF